MTSTAAAPTTTRTPGPRNRRARRGPPRLLLNLVAVALGITAWWLIAAAGVQGLPTPADVAERARTLLADGTLVSDVAASLRRVFTGFALGSLLAVPVGFLMGWHPVCRGLMEPYVQFFRTIPPLAIIPLAIVLMGIGEAPKVLVIFLAAFLNCVISTYQGVVSVDKTLINAARVLGASNAVVFLRVVVPASSPFILVGMRVGLGASWATVVAAELIAAQQGLGRRMQEAQTFYDLPTIFVALITIGILGLIMDRLLLAAEARLTGWQETR